MTKPEHESGQEHIDLIFSSLPVFYLLLDTKGKIISISNQLADILELDSEKWIEKDFAELLYNDQADNFRKNLKTWLKDGTIRNEPLCLKCGKSEKMHFRLNGVVATNGTDKPERIHCVFENETRLNATEKELSKKQAEYQRILNAFADVFFVSDLEQNIIDVSPSVKKILGYDKEEIIGRKITDLFCDSEKLTILQEEMRKNEKVDDEEFCMKNKTGEIVFLSLSAYYFYDEKGNRKGVEGLLRDIGPGKIKELEVEESNTKLTEALQRLKSSESKYQAMVDSTVTGIATMTTGGYTLSANPAFLSMSGYSEEDIIGKHFSKCPGWLAKDMKFYAGLYRQALKDELPEHGIEFQYRHKSGEIRWGEGFVSSVKDKGKTVAFQGHFIDITDRKRLDQYILKDKEEKEFLFEAAQDMLLISSTDDLYNYYADKLYSLIPKSILICNEADRPNKILIVKQIRGVSQKLRKALKAIATPFEGYRFKIDDDTFSYALQGKLGMYNQSIYDLALKQIPEVICRQVENLIKLKGIYEISLGTSEEIIGGSAILLRKNAELPVQTIEALSRLASLALERLYVRKSLNESEKQFRTLTENSPELILRADEENTIIFKNSSAGKFFPESKGEISIMNLLDNYVPEDMRYIWRSRIATACRTGRNQVVEVTLQNGDPLFLDWIIQPELNEKSKVVSLLIIGRDISNRKKDAARSLAEIEVRNKMYSVIAHDLRAPMTNMKGFLEMLTDDYSDMDDKKRIEYLGYIYQSCRNSLEMLDSLLKWAGDQIKTGSIKSSYFNIETVINQLLKQFDNEIGYKNLEFRLNYKKDISIYTDYNIFTLTMRNIISNAIKYSQKEGLVEISVYIESKQYRVVVRDEGLGIEGSRLKNLFNSEKRYPTEGTENEKGLGLGLSLTRDFLEKVNGKISIVSKINEGTTVSLSFPKEKKNDFTN